MFFSLNINHMFFVFPGKANICQATLLMKGLKYYIYTQSNRNETQLPNHPYEMTSCQSNMDVYLPLNGHPGLPGETGHSTVIYNPFVNGARNKFFQGAQLHLQKLPNGVVYRNQYIFRLPAEI